jgi:hypothetical protein
MFRLVLATCIAIAISFKTANAQDILFKLDGEQVAVKVIEITPSEVKYKLTSNLEGPTYVVPKSEIFMVEYANGSKDVFASKSKSTVPKAIEHKEEEEAPKPKREIKQKGYTNITEFAFGFRQAFTYGIHTINGYLVNPYFSVGLGVGIEAYPSNLFGKWDDATWATLPMFIDVRANFVNGPITPVFSFGAGYSIPLDVSFPHENIGGVLINPALGMKFFVSKSTALNFSLGYRFQELNRHVPIYSNESVGYDSYLIRTETHFVTVKLGVTF